MLYTHVFTCYFVQNLSGVKEDIIAALLLHPDSDECQSLIARVFPGKSVQELVHSDAASKIQLQLNAEMKRVAKLFACSADKSTSTIDSIPPVASRYLAGVEIKMAEPDAQEGKLEEKKSDTLVPFSLKLSSLDAMKMYKSTSRLSSSSKTKSPTAGLFDSSFIEQTGAPDEPVSSDGASVQVPKEAEGEEGDEEQQSKFVHNFM